MEPNCHSFQSFMVLLPSFSTGVALDNATGFCRKNLLEKMRKKLNSVQIIDRKSHGKKMKRNGMYKKEMLNFAEKIRLLFHCPALSNLQTFSTSARKSSWEIPKRPARYMAPPAPAPSLIVPVSYL